MGSTVSTTFQVARTGPVAPTQAPVVVRVSQDFDTVHLAWNALSGVATYEAVQATPNGQPMNIMANGVQGGGGGAMIQELDAQGIVGDFFAGTQASYTIPPGQTASFMVRGVTAAGSSGLGGPYSAPITASSPAGSPSFALVAITAIGTSSNADGLSVTVTLQNTGTAQGLLPGYVSPQYTPTWSAVLVNSSGRVVALVARVDNAYLNPGQRVSYQGLGPFAPVPGNYTVYAAFGPGYFNQYHDVYNLGYGPSAPFSEIPGSISRQFSI